MKKYFFLLFLIFLSFNISAHPIDTVTVHSKKMNRGIKNLVILPEHYDNEKSYPVLYLLHGYGADYRYWMKMKPSLPDKATLLGIIIVCPDGQDSWYWDSPLVESSQFETYMSIELIDFIDKNYNTISSPEGRAITGFSMGGHGGLWLGIKYPNTFGGCGSISGGVDICSFPNSWNLKKLLGSYSENKERWERHTVINLLSGIKKDKPVIIIDCGTEDFFYKVNKKLYEKLLLYNISHDYNASVGGHNSEYWIKAIDRQLQFFSGYFHR